MVSVIWRLLPCNIDRIEEKNTLQKCPAKIPCKNAISKEFKILGFKLLDWPSTFRLFSKLPQESWKVGGWKPGDKTWQIKLSLDPMSAQVQLECFKTNPHHHYVQIGTFVLSGSSHSSGIRSAFWSVRAACIHPTRISKPANLHNSKTPKALSCLALSFQAGAVLYKTVSRSIGLTNQYKILPTQEIFRKGRKSGQRNIAQGGEPL